MCRQDLHGIQVYDGQHVILLSGHECEPSRLIQCDSVRAFNAGHGVAANDPHGCRIDGYNFVLLVNRDQNVAGTRIVDRVAGTASEWDAGHERVRFRVNYRIHVAVFIGYEDTLGARCVSNAVWVINGAYAGERLQCFHIHSSYFVLSRHRCIDPAQFRNRPHSVYMRKAIEVCHDFSFLGIEDNELVGIHVSDVKPSSGGVKALVIEADCWARHGNIRDLLERYVLCIFGGGIRRAGSL